MKKIKYAALIFLIIAVLFCTVTVFADTQFVSDNYVKKASYNLNFSDVPAGSWYEPYVSEAYEYGLTTGTSSTTFSPSGKISLAEAVVFAARIHSTYIDDKYSFNQDQNPWYNDYVQYALDKGIIFADEFEEYGRYATREEFAAILSRSLPAELFQKINNIAFSSIPDVDIPDTYGEAIYMLYEAGVLTGSDDKGTFNPKSNIQRNEGITIVMRVIDLSQRRSIELLEAESLKGLTFSVTVSVSTEIECVDFIDTSFPVDLGLPKLSDKEIEYLVEKHDYDYASWAITTFADAANYVKHFNIDNFYGYSGDYQGSTRDWFWSLAPQQCLDLKIGGCGCLSSIFHMLLYDNFEHIYYCQISSENFGHSQLIFKVNDLYYLTNPNDYDVNGIWGSKWFGGHISSHLIVAEDIQAIADSMVAGLDVVEVVNTYETPAGTLPQSRKEGEMDVWIFPIGSEVTNWTGHRVKYANPYFGSWPIPDWTRNDYYVEAKYLHKNKHTAEALPHIFYEGKIYENGSTLVLPLGETHLFIEHQTGPCKNYTYEISDPDAVKISLYNDQSMNINIKEKGQYTLTLTKYDVSRTFNIMVK